MAVTKQRDDQLFVAPVKFAGPVEFGVPPTGLPGHSDPILLGDGTVADPTYSFISDPKTGQFLAAPGVLGFAANGVETTRFTELNGSVVAAPEANVGLTADIGSAQGDGVITSSYNVYSTVATAGDAATLPAVFDINSLIYIKNDGVASMDVFPALGDNAGAGLNTAVAIPSGESKIFIATVANATWTELLVSGSGDVIKVGTPLNDQVGVWTGDGTLEGNNGLKYNTTTGLQINNGGILIADGAGHIQFAGSSTPELRNEAATSTNPTVIPNKADIDTGLGLAVVDGLSLIAGGVEGMRITEAAAAIAITMAGPVTVTGKIAANQAAGPALLNEDASSTNPTLVPNQADPDTGLGRSGVNELSAITGGAESARFTTTQLRGLTGSAAVPAFTFLSDPDSGVFSVSADILGIAAGGVEGIRVTEALGVITVLNDGFTKLGDAAAPSIKQKKLTGTTGVAEGNTTNIAHGLTIGKVLGYEVLVDTAAGNKIPPVFTSVAEHEYDVFVDGTNVVVKLTATNSGSILSKAIMVLITHEE